jgi:hypothetical protein
VSALPKFPAASSWWTLSAKLRCSPASKIGMLRSCVSHQQVMPMNSAVTPIAPHAAAGQPSATARVIGVARARARGAVISLAIGPT